MPDDSASASRSAQAWGYLLAAVVFEIAFALGAKGAEGFTQLWWSIFTVVASLGGTFLLSKALRVIDMGVGYAVWTGIGAVGTVIIGAFLFHEPITWAKALCFGLIVAGAMGLKLFGSEQPERQTTASPLPDAG
jgi:quaternary ammonium compound-resistance protein SugE